MTLKHTRSVAIRGSGGLGPAAMRACEAATPAWPVKPIACVMPFTRGGLTDVTGQSLLQKLAKALGRAGQEIRSHGRLI